MTPSLELIGPEILVIQFDLAALKVSKSEKNEKKKADAERLAAAKAALEALPQWAERGFDASPFHLGAIAPEKRKAGSTPPPEVPTIEREHVEAWALTSLKEHPGRPDVEPFLRGIVEDELQTTVAWRADVANLAKMADQVAPRRSRTRERVGREAQLPGRFVERAMAAARLMPAEVLEAPTSDVVHVLQKRIKALQKAWRQAKNDGDDSVASARLLLFKHGKLVGWGEIACENATLRRTSASEADKEIALDGDAREVHRTIENTTLLLEPVFGGLDEDGAFADCDQRPGLHVQPDKREELRWGLVIRRIWPADTNGVPRAELLTAPAELVETVGEDALRVLSPPTRRKLRLRRAWFAELPADSEDEDGPTLEYWKHWDEDGETGASSRSQLLADHHDEAKAEMQRVAKRLGLPAALADTLTCAMPIHDSGKDREIWKIGMGVPRDGRAYAKSGGRGPGVRGYRHEFGSLRDALYKQIAGLDGLNGDLQQLALHLIASHHGRARPSIAAEDEEEILLPVLEQDALDAALRYVHLQRKWGPWGLAWLEALFRSVDATVSRRLEEEDEPEPAQAKEVAE